MYPAEDSTHRARDYRPRCRLVLPTHGASGKLLKNNCRPRGRTALSSSGRRWMNDIALKVRKTLRFHAARGLMGARMGWWNLARPTLEKPLFVVGCSRAGTTVVYKTFSQSRQLGS